MKPTAQHFPVVLFVMLYKVFLTFESVVDGAITIQTKGNDRGTLLLQCSSINHPRISNQYLWQLSAILGYPRAKVKTNEEISITGC